MLLGGSEKIAPISVFEGVLNVLIAILNSECKAVVTSHALPVLS
jgi:hypothetical protein